jgi:prepilin-type N-terminal cleavage/methylation domain-containing protein
MNRGYGCLRRLREDESGLTLVEMLVVLIMLGILGSLFTSVALTSTRSAKNTQQQTDINEEARLAINRMARELRQATAITAVLNPDGSTFNPAAVTSITFQADFDGDGCVNGVAPSPLPSPAPTCNAASANNPEVLTYCYDPAPSSERLVLIPGILAGTTCTQAGALPILAGNVTSLKFSYRSNQYLYDTSGDGITTWRELDAADPPMGDGDNNINTGDLGNVDSVVVDVVLLEGTHQQKYQTQVDLRNLS